MNEQIIIRPEQPADIPIVDTLVREAFYNVYIPGCVEHYLLRTLRRHPDMIPALDLVLTLGGRIIGQIAYTKAWLTAENGDEKEIVTFGPVSIRPDCQRKGYGKQLIRHSLRQAAALGYEAVVIFGNPDNYVGCGFESCKKHRVSAEDGRYPAAMLVKPLSPGALGGRAWQYRGSKAMEFSQADAMRYDDTLPYRRRERRPSQETFEILSQAYLD